MKGNPIPIESLFADLKWNYVKIHVAQKEGQTRPIDVYRLCHIYCRELAIREKAGVRKIQNCISAPASLTLATESYINTILPDLP